MSEPAAVIATHRLPAALLAEARAACRIAQLPIREWDGGGSSTAPNIIIAALAPGQRRIPDDVAAWLDAAPAHRAILCTSEPLVKPSISLASSRIVLLGPPIDRLRLTAAIRITLDHANAERADSPPPAERFEALRRHYWVAWTRGAGAAAVSVDETAGVTVAFDGSAAGGFVHLDADAAQWVLHWPHADRPLWMCSPHRLPGRWEMQRVLAGSVDKPVRMAAFPGDQVMAAWADDALTLNEDQLAAVKDAAPSGGCETLAGLTHLVARLPGAAGAVVEVR